MRRIYKYPIDSLVHVLELSNPKFLSIQVRKDIPVLWAEVDMEPTASYTIHGLLTGDEPLDGYTYISTLQIGVMVYHFYWSKVLPTDQKEE